MQQGFGDLKRSSWLPRTDPRVALSDEGLICGAGTTLARMTKTAFGSPRFAIDEDRDRCLALLSIAYGYRMPPNAMAHIEAASSLWASGEKALANLRLVFSKFPSLPDEASAYRLVLAEHLLDEGMSPDSLLAEVGLGKVWEDEPRVPEGHGRESGRWTNSIVVAATEGPPEDEEQRKEEHVLGGSTPPEVTVGGARLLDPLGGLYPGVGTGEEVPQAVAAAAQAKKNIGPGRGPVYGTAVHQEYKRLLEGSGNLNFSSEKSYMNGEETRRGMPGSVRLDAIVGPIDKPTAVFDLKTGSSRWTTARENQIRAHLPLASKDIPIFVVRP